jgi:putative colanic acid biosynthesis acetyltransferase WcaF
MNKSLRPQHLSRSNKVMRLIWRTVWIVFFRTSPRLLHAWRRGLLRLFGAKLGRGTYVYPSVQVWAPWNLEMHDHSCLSHFVDCYCVDKITVGRYATVSQHSFLCTATHDYNKRDMPLVTGPIHIGDHGWVTANVFVGPGVRIGEGAVVGAHSSVTRDVAPWVIVAGSPAKQVGMRDPTEFISAVETAVAREVATQ